MDKKIAITIQCRTDSKRLPNKIVTPIEGYKPIDLICKRLENISKYHNVYVLTTDREIDDYLAFHCEGEFTKKEQNNFHVFRGSENVLERFQRFVNNYEHDYIVRITGDDLFIDEHYLMAKLDEIKDNGYIADYYYTKNLIRGFDFEIISTKVFKDLNDKGITNYEHIEHVIKNNFKVAELIIPEGLDSRLIPVSLTLDTPKDRELIEEIIWYFKQQKIKIENVAMQEICYYLTQSRIIQKWNKNNPITVYTVWNNYPLEWLFDCIDAVMAQTKQEFDYNVIIYGTNNNINDIQAIIDKVSNTKIKLYYTKDSSFIDAIKYAHKLAKTQFVLRADADDVCDEVLLERLYSEVIESDAEVVFSNRMNFSNNNLKIQTMPVINDYLSSHALINKKILDNIEYLENQPCRDGKVLEEYIKKYNYKVKYIQQPLFYHRIHDKSITHVHDIEVLDKQIKEAYNHVED